MNRATTDGVSERTFSDVRDNSLKVKFKYLILFLIKNEQAQMIIL